jgi:RimJ/RimL family protein N-acetyltransferase
MNNIISDLSLKVVDINDHNFLFELYNQSDKQEKRPTITKENNKKFVNDFVEKKKNNIFDIWYIIKFNQRNIGSLTLQRDTNECGYWIIPEFQNKGIGSWAFNKLMTLNPRPFYGLIIHPYNKRSLRMAEKYGFKLDTYKFIKKI